MTARPHGPAAGKRRPGRRPGSRDTRAVILQSARELFGQKGFDGTSLRAVAAAAAVDVALVSHYFGNKEGLFSAALELPIQPVVSAALAGADTAETSPGRQLVRAYLGLWEQAEVAAQMRATLACVTARPEAAQVLRAGVQRALADHLPAGLLSDRADLRLSLVASQLVGLGLLRSVVAWPGLSAAGVEELTAAVGPTLDRYLGGELDH